MEVKAGIGERATMLLAVILVLALWAIWFFGNS